MAVGEIFDERSVDLELVERKASEIAQARISRAEVVQGDADAEVAKLVQRRLRRFGLGEKHGLGDFEFEPLGGEAGVGERADHGVDEIERAELDRRQIDGDRDPVAPRRGFGAGGSEHPFADRNDQAGRFGDRNEVVGRDHAPRGMTPAQQRLEAGDAIAGNVDERLIVDFELTRGERVLEIRLQGAPLLRLHDACPSGRS